MISWFVCFFFFILLVITGVRRFLVIVRNSRRLIKKNCNMSPRLSGYISILGLVFYVLKPLLGIARQWRRGKFLVRMLDIECSYNLRSGQI